MRLPVALPIVLRDGTMASPFRDFMIEVAQQIPITGSGSPEGLVEAPLYSLYIDTASQFQYRKLASSIGGDRAKGWQVTAVEENNIFLNGIIIGETAGVGIKVGDGDASDYGWRDITGQVNVKGVGVNDPDWVQIASGPFYAYRFSVNDGCWFSYHIPHDIVPSSDVHFHVHWVHDGTGSNPTQPVKWEFTYAYALGFDQAAFDMDTGATVSAESTPPATAYQHIITETTAVTIPTLTEPDGLIYCNIKRVTNGGTENDADIFMLTADIHYQSTNMATAGKAPGFYD